MQKPDSLRAALTALFPDLGRDPDRLRLWVETGKVRAINSADRNFAWDYTLNVLLGDFTGDPSGLALVINEWCRINAPELLQQGSGYTFQADILDATTFDVQFALALSEAVIVTDREGGGWNLEHPAEPAPLFPDDEPAGGLLQQIWKDGEMIVPLAPES